MRAFFALLAASVFLSGEPALAQQGAGPELEMLVDLAETLGQAHAIRALCNGESDQTWRNYMENLLEIEASSGGQRRSALTGAFNRGYRAQAGLHKSCTPDLRQVENQIAAHGRLLAESISKSYLQ